MGDNRYNGYDAEQLRILEELHKNANTEAEKEIANIIYQIIFNVQEIKDERLLKCILAYVRRLNEGQNK